MRSRLPIASLLLLALVAFAKLISGPTVAGQSRTSPFFSDAPAGEPAGAIDRRQDVQAIRRRLVRADLGLLTPADRVSGLPMRFAPSLDLNLFDDAQFVAQLERIDDLGSGRVAWVGSLIGVPQGRATLAISEGILAGSVTTLTAAYEIRWQSDGLYEIAQVDRAGFRREAEPLRVDPADLQGSRNEVAATDDGSTFDLMVVYTAAARAALGGTSAINALIALGVSETNSAYSTIGLSARMRLVDTVETTYVETGTSDVDLPNFRALSSVASRRTSVGADLVMLVVNRLNDGCGIGYQMQTVTTSFATFAYTVVDRTCISPNYTFAHELGHNMGSNHAPEDNPSAGAYSYSFGYKDSVGRFRTIMAYDCTPSCTRLLSFSSPGLASGGRPLGTSTQDNARSLAGTRTTVANFVQSVGSGAPGAPTGFTASATGSTVNLAWSAPSSGTPPTAYTIEGGSSAGLSNLANFSTGSTATTYSSGGVGNGTYYLRVKATNSSGTSGASNEATLVVGGSGCTAAPGAPSGLTITSNSGGTVTFIWSAASGSPTSYSIEAGSASGLANLANSDLGSTATSYTAIGVGNGTYYVRIRARNACGTGGASNEVVLVVGSTGGGSCASAPRSLTVVSQSAGSISLSWLAPTTGTPTSYIIEGGSRPGLSDLANLDTGSAATSFSTSGVGGGSYYLRVRSKSSCGLSAASNEALLFVVAFTGDVQVSVAWDTASDVDLHVVDSAGAEIYWGSTTSASGGQLDVDSNPACNIDGRQVENVRWGSRAPSGTYIVRVDYWSSCSVTATNYTVTVKNGSSTSTYTGRFTGSGDGGGRGSGVLITSFVHAASLTTVDAPVLIRPPQLSVPSPEKMKWLTMGR